MKRSKKLLLIVLLAITVLVFVGCKSNSSSNTKYDIEYENKAYKVTEFKLSDIKIHIQKGDKDVYANVTSDMISDEDYFKLNQAGTHEITINYKNFSKTITINLVSASLAYVDIAYYQAANGLSGDELKAALRTIISVTTKTETYENLKTDLCKTDASSEGKMYCFYCHEEMTGTWDGGVTWNREHVWPQSLGWFTTSAAGADIHHLRPAHQSENSSRGNTRYGTGVDFYEPNDNVKGDVARIIFYLYTRYAEADEYSQTKVVKSWDLLLQWNRLDPVDDLERQRNEVGYSIQGNRNPFIDYPDYAYYIWNPDYLL